MCIGCFNHLLADARLKNEQAQCPSCRAEISTKDSSRNLAVEKAVSELPTHCRFCEDEFPRHQIPFHEKSSCDERYVCYVLFLCLQKRNKKTDFNFLFNFCR